MEPVQTSLTTEQKFQLELFSRKLDELSREELEELTVYCYEQNIHQGNAASKLFGTLTGVDSLDMEVHEIWITARDNSTGEFKQGKLEERKSFGQVNEQVQSIWDLS